MDNIEQKAKKLIEKLEKTIDPNFGILKKREAVHKVKKCALIAIELAEKYSSGLPEMEELEQLKEKIQSL